ncbi:MAG: sigma-54 dependent transcriptional regulator [Thermodesulfobacteriota bacterium]|nr:sigma-54 dependent transcriptional regulator [Thermodesulfobacteriota bacterium]
MKQTTGSGHMEHCNSNKMNVLFVDDEKGFRDSFRRALRKEDNVLLTTASDGKDALEKLKVFPADVVITDVKMPRMDGLSLLEEIRRLYPNIFVLVMTGFGSIEDAVKAMKIGAYDYILKPFDFDVIKLVLKKIAGHKNILNKAVCVENERRKGYRFENIVGQDPKMFEIYQKINDIAKTRATVLITGESGTGKELIAETIHYQSPRKDKPLIMINCAALTDTLINSELFGHERGAFTGAIKQKKGHFEMADSGTILLDEIGDIPITTQVSLLRVLELGTFKRVGGTRTITVNTRVICATNKDLSEAVRERLFREDLYYRINVVSLHIPPLRERKSDIPLLADHFLKKYSAEIERDVPQISKAAMDLLVKYDWPGNVRELANMIENTVIFAKGKDVTPDDLPNELKDPPKEKGFHLNLPSSSLPLAESIMIRKVLEETNWNLKQAANELGIARGTLYSKMNKYEIKKPA